MPSSLTSRIRHNPLSAMIRIATSLYESNVPWNVSVISNIIPLSRLHGKEKALSELFSKGNIRSRDPLPILDISDKKKSPFMETSPFALHSSVHLCPLSNSSICRFLYKHKFRQNPPELPEMVQKAQLAYLLFHSMMLRTQ